MRVSFIMATTLIVTGFYAALLCRIRFVYTVFGDNRTLSGISIRKYFLPAALLFLADNPNSIYDCFGLSTRE
eukprot:Awhi_evm2s706